MQSDNSNSGRKTGKSAYSRISVPTLGTFVVSDIGVCFVPLHGHQKLVCGGLDVVARAVDGRGNPIGWLLRWANHRGDWLERVVLEDELNSGSLEYRKALYGLRIQPLSTVKGIKDLLACFILNSKPSNEIWYVTRSGWLGESDCRQYILQDGRMIGREASEQRVVLQTNESNCDSFVPAGTLAGWQDHIAALCVGNSRLVFGVSMALAAPLVRLMGVENCGFLLRNESSIGKTTALGVAASVFGVGKVGGYIKTWHSTATALEYTAQAHCDALLLLDELGQSNPRDIGSVIYMLAGGCGKGRGKASGGVRATLRWSGLFLASGEKSLAEHIAEGGKQVKAGQEVRMAEIIADAGKGFGLFEKMHGRSCAKEFADELKGSCQKFYGTAIIAFLECIVRADFDVREWINVKKREFYDVADMPRDAHGQIQRVADHFALVAATGELAIQFNIVPWASGEAMKGVACCFRAWLATCENAASDQDMERVLERFRAYLQRTVSDFPVIRKEKGFPNKSIEVVERYNYRSDKGFVRKKDENITEWLIFADAFKEICLKLGANYRDVAKVLLERGYLAPSENGRASAKQVRIGGVGNTRMYVIGGAFTDDAAEEDVKEDATPVVPGLTMQLKSENVLPIPDEATMIDDDECVPF